MPIYEYKCNSCGQVEEYMMKFSDVATDLSCTKCDGNMNRIISLSSFALKGTGWYVTDYKKSSTTESTPSRVGASASDKTAAETIEKAPFKESQSSSDTSTSVSQDLPSTPVVNKTPSNVTSASTTPA